MKRQLKVRIPERSPFFCVDGELFIDLLYCFGEAVAIDVAELVRFLANAAPGDVVIGRRLNRDERQLLKAWRRDNDSEVHARIIPRDAERWRTRPATKARSPRR